MQNKKSFRLMILIAINLAILILLSCSCAIRSCAINLGENGERIAELQKALKEKGFYGGNINGLYDFTTKKAVREFRKENSISENDDYKTFMTLGFYRKNFRCYGADVELLAKHLKSKGFIEYHNMITECENILQKTKSIPLYAYILDMTDDVYSLMDEKPTSEQYSAASESVKRHEINPAPF